MYSPPSGHSVPGGFFDAIICVVADDRNRVLYWERFEDFGIGIGILCDPSQPNGPRVSGLEADGDAFLFRLRSELRRRDRFRKYTVTAEGFQAVQEYGGEAADTPVAVQ